MRRRLPRAVNLVAQAVVFPALLVGAPVSLSERGGRHGWSAGRPGPLNLVGALPLGAGAALLLWAMSSHYRAAPRGWEIRRTPDYLLVGGPYRFSRNPMYVGEAAIWAGWAVLFGSLPVTAGLLAVTAVLNGAVRLEERMLHQRWAAYDDYRAQVPRWLRLPGRISLLEECAGSHLRVARCCSLHRRKQLVFKNAAGRLGCQGAWLVCSGLGPGG